MADQQPPLKDPALMTPDEIAAETAALDSVREHMSIDESDKLLTEDEMAADYEQFKREQKYADRPVAATAAAIASGLTLGLSDQAFAKTGLVDKETLGGLSEFNQAADIVGQGVGMIAPALVTGGGSLAAQGTAQGLKAGVKAGIKGAIKASGAALAERAALKAEAAVAKAIGTAAAETGTKKLVSEIVKKSIAKGAGSAVEGAAFGAGQLIREDAIGRADLNAENLLAYAGEGALIGGGLGAALVPGGAVLKNVGGGLSKGLKKVGAQIFDAERDAAKLMDLTPAQIAKFKDKNPKFLEGLPDFLRNKVSLKLTDTAESLVTKLEDLETSAVTQIDDSIEQLDAKLAANGSGIGPGIYNDVANEVEKRFVEPYKGLKSMESYSSKAKEFVEDFRTLANDVRLENRRLSFKEIRDMRIKMDKMAKAFYKSADPSEGAKAAFAARDALKQVLSKYADAVDPKLGAQMAEANMDFHYAHTLKPRISMKAEKQRDFVNFKDLLLGSVGAELGGAGGVTLAAANKLLHSDLKRKMVILASVEKATQVVAKRASESIGNFLQKSAKPARLLSTGALVRSALAQPEGDGEKKPKNKVEAFRNIQENVVRLAADPIKMYDRGVKSTSVLALAAPQTAEAMQATMKRAVDFLARKAPKDARDVGVPIWEPKYEPSQLELSKFERYMQVIDSPLSVLSDLEQGTLTRDHVEALKVVYPNLYNDIRVEAMKQAQTQPNLSYPKRIQMGILLDLPTDASLSPQFIVQMQQNFVPPEERQTQMQANGVGQQGSQTAVKPTMSGAAKMDPASRQMTGPQSVAAKGASS